MRRVPWFTLAAFVAVAISPLGEEIFHSSFSSGEQLSRSLGQFMLEAIVAIAVALVVIEVLVRHYLHKRRSKQAAG
jgi:ribose/xylose/arabinose/galactoside ABC-type transport system permease subunit